MKTRSRLLTKGPESGGGPGFSFVCFFVFLFFVVFPFVLFCWGFWPVWFFGFFGFPCVFALFGFTYCFPALGALRGSRAILSLFLEFLIVFMCWGPWGHAQNGSRPILSSFFGFLIVFKCWGPRGAPVRYCRHLMIFLLFSSVWNAQFC